MTSDQIDRVFGRGRLKMATGDHVEVFREAAARGERRRYTKRFLKTPDGDFGQWTEREWRILARLIGHGIACVPEVVQFDRGMAGGMQLVQTYDAGATVDQWATILPVARDGTVHRHVFEDCAHWWALAHHCLLALDQIHALELIHLDIKGDNVCVPVGPAQFDPDIPDFPFHPVFDQLALIDFAFSLVSREALTSALPIGWQKDYDYQSPRLLLALEAGRHRDLKLTRELDWRCDMYSLGAMLKRYLPDENVVHDTEQATGWSLERYADAKHLLLGIREAHDHALPQRRPHQEFIAVTRALLAEPDLRASLERGWTLARDARVAPLPASPITPLTRLAPSIRIIVSPRDVEEFRLSAPSKARAAAARPRSKRVALTATAVVLAGALIAVAMMPSLDQHADTFLAAARSMLADAMAQWDRLRVASRPTQDDSPDRTEQKVAAADSDTNPRPAADEAGAREPMPAEKPAVDPVAPAADMGQSASSPTAPSETAASAEPLRSTPPPDELPPSPPGSTKSSPASTASHGVASRPAARTTTRGASGGRPAPARAPSLAAKPSAGGGASAKDRVARSAPPKASPTTRVQLAALGDVSRSARGSVPPSQAVSPPSLPATTSLSPDPPAAPPTPASKEPVRVETTAPVVAHPVEMARIEAPAAVAPPAPATTNAQPEARVSGGTSPSRPRPESQQSSTRSLAALLGSFLQLGRRDGKSAPIEERSVIATAPPTALPRPSPSAAPRNDVRTSPPIPRLESERAPAPPVPDSPTRPAPELYARVQSAPPPAASASWELVSPAGASTPPTSEPSAARPSAPQPAPRMAPPRALVTQTAALADVPYGEYVLQARRALAESIPRSAAMAEADASRVLWIAANASSPTEDGRIADAARSGWRAGYVPTPSVTVAPGVARRFDEVARQAYRAHRDLTDVFELQLRAFGANPSDPEVAGNLAFLYLKLTPPQPETARQLALHAMALRGAQLRVARPDDWTTFAIASALSGREDDARNALFVTIAVARDLDVSCRAALSSLASYGDPLRRPVRAMMQRIQATGRQVESPSCAWPVQWVAGAR